MGCLRRLHRVLILCRRGAVEAEARQCPLRWRALPPCPCTRPMAMDLGIYHGSLPFSVTGCAPATTRTAVKGRTEYDPATPIFSGGQGIFKPWTDSRFPNSGTCTPESLL